MYLPYRKRKYPKNIYPETSQHAHKINNLQLKKKKKKVENNSDCVKEVERRVQAGWRWKCDARTMSGGWGEEKV